VPAPDVVSAQFDQRRGDTPLVEMRPDPAKSQAHHSQPGLANDASRRGDLRRRRPGELEAAYRAIPTDALDATGRSQRSTPRREPFAGRAL